MQRLRRTCFLSTSEGKDTELILELTWHLFKDSTQFTHGRGFFFVVVVVLFFSFNIRKMLDSKLNCVLCSTSYPLGAQCTDWEVFKT